MRALRSLARLCLIAGACGIGLGVRADVGSDWRAVAGRLAPGAGALDLTPHGTQPGLSMPLLAPDNCNGCHGGNSGTPQAAFRPFPAWAGSMMANAMRDPVFWAALDVANHDLPGAGDFCLRCHTPNGWLGGRVVKSAAVPSNDPVLGAAGCLLAGAYDSTDNAHSDFDGDSCHFCHRLMAQGPGGEAGYIGNDDAWVDDAACANPDISQPQHEPCRRGPYAYAAGAMQPPHDWLRSDYHASSALCGLCHDVSSPDTPAGPLKTLKLADGTDTGLAFPVERTFSEWQQSDYAAPSGQSCQACHMPASEAADATACAIPGYPNRSGDLPVHAFAGGNTWVPAILAGQYAPGIVAHGGSDRSASFEQTIAWAREMLGAAAEVASTIESYTPPSAGQAGALAFAVRVTNHAGHKLPTGYGEGRRMWLNVQVHDADGALLFESAAYDPASGRLSRDAQARVYEVLQGIYGHNGGSACDVLDDSGAPMFHFVLSDCVAKDNRIPPQGFRPATGADPAGYALRPVPTGTYPETSPGSGVLVNFDVAHYTLAVPPGTRGPLTATARLYYQTASREYVAFLRDTALTAGFAGENALCAGQPGRPFAVGPQGLTRGAYLYALWSEPTALDRVFADAFDGTVAPPGYGRSPPELMQTASASTAH